MVVHLHMMLLRSLRFDILVSVRVSKFIVSKEYDFMGLGRSQMIPTHRHRHFSLGLRIGPLLLVIDLGNRSSGYLTRRTVVVHEACRYLTSAPLLWAKIARVGQEN